MAKTDSTARIESIPEIAVSLNEINSALIAMHDLAVSHHNGVSRDTLSTVVELLSKQASQSIDVCLRRIGGAPCGYFDDEKPAKAGGQGE